MDLRLFGVSEFLGKSGQLVDLLLGEFSFGSGSQEFLVKIDCFSFLEHFELEFENLQELLWEIFGDFSILNSSLTKGLEFLLSVVCWSFFLIGFDFDLVG